VFKKLRCWLFGHSFHFDDIVDGEEWMANDTWFDDAIYKQYFCLDCGLSEREFITWGTTEEHKDFIFKYKNDNHGE
jgi:hypothetical protein